MKRYFAIILFAAALASCTPKLYDAQVEVPENYRFAGDFPQDSVSLPFAWWEIFGDSTLNRLVEHALENNRNLAQAASRIFEARANIAVARAPFLPSVGLNLSGAVSPTSYVSASRARCRADRSLIASIVVACLS